MVRPGELEYSQHIAGDAEGIWNWSSPAGRLRARRRGRLIAQAAHLGLEADALELGCGTGLFTETFAGTGARIVAIDVSPELLDQARDKQIEGRVTFRIEDAEALAFDDGSFDAVIGSSVLHHLDLRRSLGEIRRVLKRGGRLAFAEPNMLNPQIALQSNVPVLRRWADFSPEETAFFRWRLSGELRREGFCDVHIQPFDFLHPAVPKPLIPMVRGMGVVLERLPLFREIAGSLIISARRGD